MGVLASVLRDLWFDVCIDDLGEDIYDRKWLELHLKRLSEQAGENVKFQLERKEIHSPFGGVSEYTIRADRIKCSQTQHGVPEVATL